MLELDAGYLSRLLRGFKRRAPIKAGRSATDARQTRLLTPPPAEVATLLGPLSDAQQHELLAAMACIEALLAARFVEQFDPARQACWIAERDGGPIGSVYLVQARDDITQAIEPGTAQLRWLLVEPSARGLRLGVALVDECERFARQLGYQRIRLRTHSLLRAARGIYERAGYRLLASQPHHSFGKDLVSETWELELG